MKKNFLIILILCCSHQVFPQQTVENFLRGTVVDTAGLPIERAQIKVVSNSGKIVSCQTGAEGKFTCETNFDEGFTLTIEARDFSILRRTYANKQDFLPEEIFTLRPGTLREEVQVTANRIQTRIGETAASITALSSEEIRTSAAPTVDDTLRQVPGFSLFRRTGSRYANPTAQGVSLRGVGASGASRSLVLFDGVPLNDSFGGWIQWSRVPTIAVERIEVLRGGAASLYGGNSLSGTVNILPRRTNDKFVFSAEAFGGSQHTFSGSTFIGFRQNDWTADFVASHFQTRGYILIEENERGAVDDFAGSRNQNLSARIAKSFGETAEIFFRPAYFSESRTNGTPLQINRTHLRQFVLGGSYLVQSPKSRVQSPESRVQNQKSKIQNPKLDWRFYGGTQTYDQTFSAVAAGRNTETLNRIQRVPAQNFGFSGQASAVLWENHTFVAGFEAREVRGTTNEIGFVGANATTNFSSGGRERTYGFFLQDYARIGSRFIVAGSVRFDDWKNFRAFSSTRTLATNQLTTIIYQDRNENAFSPQISLLYQASPNFSIFALASKSFRAPTLNELYRGFRVGNVVTLANENLRAEKASNFETGASFVKNRFYLRGNIFLTEINNPISNVTLSAVPALITRRRQNVGKIRARGAEIEAETRIGNFSFNVGYLFSDSRIAEFPANRNLENLRVPQTARHQFTFQTRYTRAAWNLAFQGRASSEQFDDDLNLFRLEPYFQLDAFISRRIGENLQIFAAAENLFNSRYSVGRTPIRTVSSPFNMRVGVRWN